MPQTGKSSALKRSARSIVLVMVSSFSRHLSTDVLGHVYANITLVVHLSSAQVVCLSCTPVLSKGNISTPSSTLHWQYTYSVHQQYTYPVAVDLSKTSVPKTSQQAMSSGSKIDKTRAKNLYRNLQFIQFQSKFSFSVCYLFFGNFYDSLIGMPNVTSISLCTGCLKKGEQFLTGHRQKDKNKSFKNLKNNPAFPPPFHYFSYYMTFIIYSFKFILSRRVSLHIGY